MSVLAFWSIGPEKRKFPLNQVLGNSADETVPFHGIPRWYACLTVQVMVVTEEHEGHQYFR
jgi:hypothetical protein